jgi:hypothetical protein
MSATKPTPDDAARLDDAELATVEETDGYFLLATAAKRYRIPLAELTAAVEYGFLEATKINGRLHTTAVCIQRWQTRPPEPPAGKVTPRLPSVSELELRIGDHDKRVADIMNRISDITNRISDHDKRISELEGGFAEMEATVQQLIQHLPPRPSEPRGETTKKS